MSKYCEAAKKLMEVRGVSPEGRKIVKWNVEDTFSWLRRTVGANYDDFQERLQHIKVSSEELDSHDQIWMIPTMYFYI